MEHTRRLVRQAKWTSIRAKGFWRFVLLRGALGWGGTVFLFADLLPHLLHRPLVFDPFMLLVKAGICGLTGLFMGVIGWRFYELRYPDPLP